MMSAAVMIGKLTANIKLKGVHYIQYSILTLKEPSKIAANDTYFFNATSKIIETVASTLSDIKLSEFSKSAADNIFIFYFHPSKKKIMLDVSCESSSKGFT